MTKEQIKKKAIDFIRRTKCNPKDRPDEQIEILHEEELELLIGFASEITNELQDQLSEVELHLHAESHIKALENQIDKMKCCQNCKYFDLDVNYKAFCSDKKTNIENPVICKCKNWQFTYEKSAEF